MNKKSKFPYQIVCAWSEEDKAFLARVPAIRHCIAYGDTVEKAVKEVRIAAEAMMETLVKHGKPVPMPDTALERLKVLAPVIKMAVIARMAGATYPDEIARVRALAPTLPLLIPGIGAQGGDAEATVAAGWRAEGGRTVAPVIISSSRAVLYASRGENFAEAARAAADATRVLLNRARPAS